MDATEEVYNILQEKGIRYTIPKEYDIEADYYAKGIIRPEDLKDGHYYMGKCRNATFCKWDAERKLMWHKRYKFGWRTDNVNYIDNDNGFDLFIAIKEVNEEDVPAEQLVDKYSY